MYLLRVQLISSEQPQPVTASVWVNAGNASQAETLAARALATEGWRIERVEDTMITTADDYFQRCPSQQAFERAQRSGVAWRFDGDN